MSNLHLSLPPVARSNNIDSDDDDCSRRGQGDRASHTTKGSTGRTNSRDTDDDDNIDNIKDQLTKLETTAVFRLRVTVMIVLVAAAVGISVTVFLLTRNAQEEELRIQYNGAAEVSPYVV
jgi:hypothetical protein